MAVILWQQYEVFLIKALSYKDLYKLLFILMIIMFIYIVYNI